MKKNNYQDNMRQSVMRSIMILALLFMVITPVISLAAPAPVIFYTDITSGPNTGGENNNGAYLSIFGTNFGSDINAISVTIGGGAVARKMSLGTSLARSDVQQLSVQVGPSAVTGSIKLSVGGLDSNTDKTFTVRSGEFYFISPTGSNATGVVNDISHPYYDPQYVHGLSGFGAGDFLVVLPGTYDLNNGTYTLSSGRWLYNTKAGTDGNPITFYGYPNSVSISISVGSTHLWKPYVSSSDWVLANFDVTRTVCNSSVGAMIFAVGGSTTACPMTNTFSRGRFVNISGHGGCGTSNQGSDGIVVGRAENVKLLGVSIHDHAKDPINTIVTDHPIYFSGQQRDIELGWSSIYNIAYSRGLFQTHVDSFGGTCQGVKTLTDIYVHDNYIESTYGQPMVISGGTGDIYIYNNIISFKPTDTVNYSDIVFLGGGGGQMNARFFNNTVYGNPRYNLAGRMLSFGDTVQTCTTGTVTMYNNIFYATESQDAYWGNATGGACMTKISDYNIWYGGLSMPSWMGTHDINANPLFVNAAGGDFRLQSGSPAIGAGNSELQVRTLVRKDIAGIVRPKNINTNVGFDIGAFQYAVPVLPKAPILKP